MSDFFERQPAADQTLIGRVIRTDRLDMRVPAEVEAWRAIAVCVIPLLASQLPILSVGSSITEAPEMHQGMPDSPRIAVIAAQARRRGSRKPPGDQSSRSANTGA